ncbi:hypothetical protein MGMO_174c00300 [Methyloglobulus morosus KoM1]|uniref:Uncharacterized protein n=1 Tax=Methyloglobulus morosus KoM1 TaxID=1116472 RepID=V5BGT5_9GAMM|nr:hypothetical protein [Methyloglobulus morosus]ESS66964.1 hypothetical protein MGMO_174c00300 [Methyloglobulus morosus KoM1]
MEHRVIPAGIAGSQVSGMTELTVHGTGYPLPGGYDVLFGSLPSKYSNFHLNQLCNLTYFCSYFHVPVFWIPASNASSYSPAGMTICMKNSPYKI